MPSYQDLLKRAKEGLPQTTEKGERFRVPPAEVLQEGASTVLRNFAEICDVINREPEQVFAYLLREIGTAGSLDDNRRAVFKGRLSADDANDRINSYVEEYVLCGECRRPDTRIVKEDRIPMLECDACGARRSLRVVKKAPKVEEEGLQAGQVYEVMIQDVGKKGDGVAKRDKYVIYVPGTAKGSIVKVRIEKVVGTVAFAKVATE